MSAFESQTGALRVPEPRQRALTRADIAGQFESLTGRRVVLVNAEGTWFDYRAVSEVLTRRTGFGDEAVSHAYVAVQAEGAWYAKPAVEGSPGVLLWPAGAVWVEGSGAA